MSKEWSIFENITPYYSQKGEDGSILPPWEQEEGIVEQFQMLLPSVAYLAIAFIPFGEKSAKWLQKQLNKLYPEPGP